MRRLLFSIFLCLFLLPTLTGAETVLPFETTVSGTVSSTNMEDVYQFSVPNKGTVKAKLQATDSKVSIELRDSNNQIVEELEKFHNSGPGYSSWTQPVLLDPGEYYFYVKKSEEFDSSNYSLLLSYLVADNNDVEPNGTKEDAMNLAPNAGHVKGLIYGDDEIDYYKIVLPEAGRLWLHYKTAMSGGSATLYPVTLPGKVEWPISIEEVLRTYHDGSGEWKGFVDLEAGVYYFKIWGDPRPNYFVQGLYEIETSFTPAKTIDPEPNNNEESATVISAGKSYSGFLSYTDADDFYKFEMPYDGYITIHYSAEFSTSFFTVPYSNDRKGKLGEPYFFSQRMELSKGIHFLHARKYRLGGVYTFSIDLEPEIGLNFTDVPSNYFPAVKFLLMKGVTSGINYNTFGTNEKIKRVDAAILLANMLELDVSDNSAPSFSDIPKRAWGHINTLKKYGIMGGKSSTFFGANDYITRGEMALILNRAYYFDVTGPDIAYTDVPSKYYLAVHHLVNNHISNGKTPTTFGTNDPITRGENAIFLQRASKFISCCEARN